MENKNYNKPFEYDDNHNPNQCRRPFNPRFFPRDKRNNKDQNIQPPFQNNMVKNDESNEIYDFDIEDLDPNIYQLDDSLTSNFLTKFDYHYAKVSNYDEKYGFEQVSYIPYVFQVAP